MSIPSIAAEGSDRILVGIPSTKRTQGQYAQ